jgi:hypothetical protein
MRECGQRGGVQPAASAGLVMQVDDHKTTVCRDTSRADHRGLGAHTPVAGKCRADQVVVDLMVRKRATVERVKRVIATMRQP